LIHKTFSPAVISGDIGFLFTVKTLTHTL